MTNKKKFPFLIIMQKQIFVFDQMTKKGNFFFLVILSQTNNCFIFIVFDCFMPIHVRFDCQKKSIL